MALFGGGAFGVIWILVLAHFRGPCLLVVLLEVSGSWFFLALEDFVYDLHIVGDEAF